MSRKIIDTYPVFTITVGTPGWPFERRCMTAEEAEEAREEFAELLADLKAQTRRQYDVEHRVVSEAQCEHCNAPWTEDGDAFNGGCCGLDEANNPVRLRDLRTLAEAIDEAVFYSFDEGECGRVAIDWPNLLAGAVIDWLDAGRPADRIAALVPLAQRCDGRDWCTVWSDPGPSGCSLARLPDRVVADESPNQLAQELCSLLDDMGLLPARKVVA